MADTERADSPKRDPIFDIEPPLMQAYYCLRLITLIDTSTFDDDAYEGAIMMLGLNALENLVEAQKQFQAAVGYRREGEA